ncbi:hypothetical protein AURDEDRAFT_151214 [Auricularia subglabra TFB-10046 SS5]|nr:hypothetical protein AURDEDRAFT_151214 [Auricularia subglabra TFB-10046 SS5]
MSFFRRSNNNSPAIPPPQDQQAGPNKLRRPQDPYGAPAGGQDRYGAAPDRYGAAPDRYGQQQGGYGQQQPGYGQQQSGYGGQDRYGAAPDRYGAAPDRYGTPDRSGGGGQPGGQPDRYGGQQDRYGGGQQAPARYGTPNQQQQQAPDRYARSSPAPTSVRSADPYSRGGDAKLEADRAALFSGYNPNAPRRLGNEQDPSRFPSEQEWDRRREEGGDEEEDVEAIKTSIKQTKQESLASTRNALRIAREAEETATNTLVKLGDQSEKLGATERHLDVAKYNSRRAEDKVDELKQLNKSIFRPVIVFNKDKKRAAQEAKMLARHQEEQDEMQRNASDVRESQARVGQAAAYGRQNSYGDDQYDQGDGEALGGPVRGAGGGGSGRYRTEAEQRQRQAQRKRYQFEATASDDELEDELDDNLDGIADAVARMKNLGLAMGQEVDRQNDRIKTLERKTDDVDVAVVRNTNRLKRY